MSDHPVDVCVRQAGQYIRAGHHVYQKFTCDKCGSRQTMETPNVFYKTGKCEECGHVTDIEKKGCNYMLITGAKL